MAKTSTILESNGWKTVKVLGSGGQASVYKVTKVGESEGDSFALKVLRAEEGTQAYERFHREIESLQKLSHPAILRVFDHRSIPQERIHYYVMEYIPDALALKTLIGTKDNPFANKAVDSLDAYIQIVDAISAYDKVGIVHRDLSLGNVLVDSVNKSIKIIDFGCCHIDDGRCVTLTDEAVGTPHYRAPECDGYSPVPPSIQADFYSVGKILWSLITNQKAFDREKPVFTNLALSKILPNNEMAWHFHDIFAKTIRHDPAHRYDSATSALEDAKRIRGIINNRFPPLETVVNENCPICGVGKFAVPNRFQSSFLVGPNELKTGSKDNEIFAELQDLGFTSGQEIYNLRVCLNCGVALKSVKSIPRKLMKLRAALE